LYYWYNSCTLLLSNLRCLLNRKFDVLWYILRCGSESPCLNSANDILEFLRWFAH
jgi:hypothetical protein